MAMPRSVEKNQVNKTPGKPSSSLPGLYGRWFHSTVASTPQELDEVFKLRYDVYCEETEFLSKEENLGGRERDRFDDHSVQALLSYLPTADYAGTLRIVLPQPDKPGADLPARLACDALNQIGDELPLETTGELSRFAVASKFRKRDNDTLYPGVESGETDPRRVLPHITLGLMHSAFEITKQNNLTHLCAIIDPLLLRLLRRLGITFQKVGGLVDFHGLRQPVYYDYTLFEQMKDVRPDIFEVITQSD